MLTYEEIDYTNEGKLADRTFVFSDGHTYRVNYKINGRQRETVTHSKPASPYKFLRSERSTLDALIGGAQRTSKHYASRVIGQAYFDGNEVAVIPSRPDLPASRETLAARPVVSKPVAPPPVITHQVPWRELCETVVHHGGAVEIGGVKIAKIRPNGFTDEGNQIKGLEARLADAEAKAEYLQRQLDTYAANRALGRLKHEAAVSHVDAHIDGSLFDGLSKVVDK